MSLRPPKTVRQLQATLHAKAKEAPGYRFYSLHDKMYREDVLTFAYRLSRRNGGASGVDGQSFGEIESSELEAWLGALAQDLKEKTYQPEAVLRVWIQKANGGRRPLGIPTVRDRIVQTALKMVLEPIFERDFLPANYGFRPKRGCKDALRKVDGLVKAGYTWVVDLDFTRYFDTIPHGALLERVKEKIGDGKVLSLIERFLQQDILEGMKRWRPNRGTPQGAVLTPPTQRVTSSWIGVLGRN